MQPIRAVIFDFGNVLYNQPNINWVRRWRKFLRWKDDGSAEDLMARPEKSEFIMNVMLGKVPESELWNELARKWKMSALTVRLLQKSAVNRFRLNKTLIEFARALRPAHLVSILSNAGSDLRKNYIQPYGFEDWMDDIVISAEVGLVKPDAAIYQLALERLKLTAEQAVFVDDLAENVEAARQAGLHAVHHTGNRATLSALTALLAQAG